MIRVMVVDDHEFIRTTVCDLIDSADDMETVGEAAGGSKAVEVARRTRPDVTLMDLRMPGTNGIEATRALKDELPDVRVIVLTSSTNGQDVKDAAAAGAVGFPAKGGEPDVLLAAVRSAAATGSAWDRRSAEILRRAC